jgi:O-antigen/teichoic acid export membrane protein
VKKRIKHLGSHFLKHELVSGSLFIFSGSILGNFFAFLLNVFLARNLADDYAIFAALTSVIILASIPVTSMNAVIVRFAADYFVKKQDDKLKTLYLLFLKFVLGLSLFAILIFFIFSNPLKNYLKIDDSWYMIATGFVIASYYLSALNNAFLQGMLKFKFISFLSISGSLIKLISGVVLVYAGYKVFGGLGALFLMAFGSYLIAFMPLTKILKEKASGKKISLDIKQIFNYAVPTLIAILFLTSFTSTDIILVKHFFAPDAASSYAKISLMGKIIFYFTAPIPMVMFPLLVKRHATGVNFNNIFYLSLILVIVPSIIITVFYYIFPNFVLNVSLGGGEVLYFSKYLGMFGLYLTIFSLVNVCVNFFLSLNITRVFIPVVITAILQIILIYIFHSDLYHIIGVSIISLTILFAFLVYMFLKKYGNFGKLKENIVVLNGPGI